VEHRFEEVAALGDALERHLHREVAGPHVVVSSDHSRGVETGAPGFGRTEYTDAIVFPCPFWR